MGRVEYLLMLLDASWIIMVSKEPKEVFKGVENRRIYRSQIANKNPGLGMII